VQKTDLLVVGGGTAGLVAAKTAGRMGARVLLVEEHRTGGDCLRTGCVPSKALLAAADDVAIARAAARWGLDAPTGPADLAAVMAHVRDAVATIEPVDSPAAIEATGASVVLGRARLTGPHEALVAPHDGPLRTVRFRRAVLATGASPTVPAVPGLAESAPLTSDTVWDLDTLPSRLLVLGGGGIGCELGQAFARLGSHVTLVEGAERLLPREDPEASAAVRRALEADGVTVHTGRPLARVEAGAAHLHDGTGIAFDRVLVAVGRTPRTDDLGLAEAGVETTGSGHVVVDDHLRTTNPAIWAAGDLTGHAQLTHVASTHGSLAATHAVLGVPRTVDPLVPRVTYTDPEVAAVGASTAEADLAPGQRVIDLPHRDVDRAVAEGRTDGATRLTVDRRGRLLGATVVGPRAGETLGELALAVKQGLSVRDVASLTHAYPTWNDGVWNATTGDLRRQLERPATRRVLGAVVRGRRWWLDRRD